VIIRPRYHDLNHCCTTTLATQHHTASGRLHPTLQLPSFTTLAKRLDISTILQLENGSHRFRCPIISPTCRTYPDEPKAHTNISQKTKLKSLQTQKHANVQSQKRFHGRRHPSTSTILLAYVNVFISCTRTHRYRSHMCRYTQYAIMHILTALASQKQSTRSKNVGKCDHVVVAQNSSPHLTAVRASSHFAAVCTSRRPRPRGPTQPRRR